LNSTLKGEIQAVKDSLASEVAALRAGVQKELHGITDAVEKERLQLEELSASKSIKNMQKDLEKIAKN
nr:hypothetical protein [Candidatus Sigynarchaeota archaeon]